MSPQPKTVSTALEGDVAIVKINRTENANAIGDGVMPDLLSAFKWALNETSVKVVVFSGEGRFFSAGMDLVDLPLDGPVLPDAGIAVMSELHELLINADKVLIAAVNGPAVGWGNSCLALFDLVYSVADAYFFTPFVKWGLCAEACSSVSFARIMGRQKAAAIILAGERMTAKELESLGLITKILPKDNFMGEVLKIAMRIAKQPAGSLAFNKQLMMIPYRAELLAANERECEGLRQRGRTSEPREAIKAFGREQGAKRKDKTSKL